jgi:hypothetical protein
LKSQGVVSLIRDDLNVEVGFFIDLSTFRVSDRFVSDFIESIRSIRNKFSKENFFVRIESVDDKTHQLLNISIESKMFRHFYVIFSL